jgi:hypothetical protein
MPIHPNAHQCQHIKVDGIRCGSPAMEGSRGCYFHNSMKRRFKEFNLPPLEDANSIQVAVMEIMRALISDRIDRAKAATLLYALQIAHANLRNISLSRGEGEEDPNQSLASLLKQELTSLQFEAELAAEAGEKPNFLP